MAEEVGYTSRVRVGAAAPLPGVSDASMGAGFGQAIGQVGEVIQQEKLEDARIERSLRDNAEWSAVLVEDAKAREALQTLAREGRNSDAPGHAERIGKALEAQRERLTGLVTSPRLKQQLDARIAEWGGNLRAREADWEFLRGQEKTVENVGESLKLLDGEARRAKTPLEFDKVVQTYRDGLKGLDLSDEVLGKLDREVQERAALGFVRGRIDAAPEEARALLDSGALDKFLTGDQVDVLRNGAEVEMRRIEAQRERETAEAKASLREKVQTFEQAEGMGLVQDDTAYDQAIVAAQALGDDSLVLKLTGLKANNAFTKVWGPENATALQREQRIAVLAGKGKLGPQEALELKFLRDKAPGWASQEASDPVGQAAMRGGTGAPPVVDFAEPKSIAARGQWAAARSAEGRRVPAFTATEARELGKLYDSGRQGEEQVLAVLAALPPAQAMESAKQIDPNDRTLPIIATLDERRRNMARRGREALKANGRLLADMLKEDPDLDEAVATLNRGFEDALRNVPPDQRSAIFETAKQIAAGQLDKFGQPLNSELWEISLNLALGGQTINGERLGGLGKWGERTFLLPQGVSGKSFTGAVISEAQTSKDPPVNPDGSTANLYRLIPVAVGSGIYEFRNGAGTSVKRKSGKVYQVRVRPR